MITNYMQWLTTKGISAVHLNALDQKQFESVLGTVKRGQMKRRLSILILGIEIAIAAFEQLKDHFAVVLAGGTMQQISHALTASVVGRRIARQRHR